MRPLAGEVSIGWCVGLIIVQGVWFVWLWPPLNCSAFETLWLNRPARQLSHFRTPLMLTWGSAEDNFFKLLWSIPAIKYHRGHQNEKGKGARVENRFGMLERTIIRWHAEISHYRMLPSEAGELSIVIIVTTVKESDEKTAAVKSTYRIIFQHEKVLDFFLVFVPRATW